MNRFINYKNIKNYISPSLILGGILLFGLINPILVDAAIIVTGTTTSTTHPLCHYPPCHSTTTTTTHPLCHYPSCTTTTTYPPTTTTTTTHPVCHYPTVNITANPTSIQYNGSAVLHWASYNTNYCTASASPFNSQWSGSVSLNGDKSIKNLTKTTTFKITCRSNCHYDTVTDSATVYVQTPITRYACNPSTYQCYVSSSGPYTSLNTCQANCQAPAPTRYACNTSTWQCYQTTSGGYTSLSTCQSNCQPPVTRYACNTNTWQCYQTTSGGYTSLSTCQSNCQPPVTRYACNTNTWQCYVSSTGSYTSLSSCQSACQSPPPTRYACNPSTYQCYVSSSGPYTSLNTCQSNCQAPAPQFDFSLTNSGNIVVTKPSYGSVSGSNIITANLVSGTAQSVSFSQSGLPYGISASSLYSCYPTCSKTNTLTIDSSASVGTFPITVTATGGGITRTTIYNLIIQDSYTTPLYVSCYSSPSTVQVNETTTFYSNVSGGTGNYSYNWSGAAYGNSSYVQRTFSSSGTYIAYLTVYDSQNQSASTSCSVNIQSQTTTPLLNLWADDYTLNQGESTYLRWTSANANYCTASNGWSGNKSTSGYESVSPNSDTTYSLTCYGSAGQIMRSVTIYVASPGANLNLTKLGRNLSAGDRAYSKVIRVAQGDIIEFYLTVTAGSSADLQNVVLTDNLPSVFSYQAGTTKVDGIIQTDGITTTGLSLGTISRGTSKTVIFQALSTNPGTYLTYTNTAQVTASGISAISDNATITYGLVAGAAAIKTGAKNSLLISIIISLISSIMIWYYLKFNPKGKLAFVAIESKARDFSLAYLRRKMIRQNRN